MKSKAPYNFIPFPQKAITRYKNMEDLPKWNRESDDLKSGYIEYSFVNKTPLAIKQSGNEQGGFKNSAGQYGVPGNSIRGMLRTAVSILGACYVDPNSISDDKFYFREIAGNKKLRGIYRDRMGIDANARIARNIRAGIIKCTENGGKETYEITETFNIGDKPYYRISEKNLKKQLGNSFEHYLGYSEYDPYWQEISFDVENNKVKKIYVDCQAGSQRGFILSGGKISNKKAHYIVSAETNQRASEIDKATILNYKQDLVRTKKATIDDHGTISIKRSNELYALPEKDKIKPVFFFREKDAFVFGFTPYLRIPYKRSVHDCIPRAVFNAEGLDYLQSMFGFADTSKDNQRATKENYKGRLSFLDALIEEKNHLFLEERSAILAQPQASAVAFYLSNEGGLMCYDDDAATMAGYKQYWLHPVVKDEDEAKQRKVATDFKPYKEGLKFRGKIYFENLADDELGLLLTALKPNKHCLNNIGLAKPLGYGAIDIAIDRLVVDDKKARYSSLDTAYMLDETEKIEDYKKLYRDYFVQAFGEKFNSWAIKDAYVTMKQYHEEDTFYRYMKVSQDKDKNPLESIANIKAKYDQKLKKAAQEAKCEAEKEAARIASQKSREKNGGLDTSTLENLFKKY